MKVLIVGRGGREHVLAWKLSQSPKIKRIFCAPGNAGTDRIGENVNIQADDIPALLKFAKEKEIELTIVGPEAPLVNGIVDEFQKNDLKIFGPTAKAAMIEGSKEFSKEIMKEARIPTAEFITVTKKEEIDSVLEKFDKAAVKANGLAAGKGVLLCNSKEEIKAALEKNLIEKAFGDASSKVVVEELLEGEEASIMAFCDGKNVKMMVSSQDHKRALDNDEGQNTGGMGAYSPAPVVEGLEERIKKEVMQPVVDEMKRRGTPYIGILYAGLMIKDGNFKVLEFNARFGDPESQCVIPRLEDDLSEVILSCLHGELYNFDLKWKKDPACCVVIASRGYPGSYEKGKEIIGIENADAFENVHVFHAGTKLDGSRVLTNGGRVLGVTGLGETIKEAVDNAYKGVSQIKFDEMHYRKDIGKRALDR